MQTGQLEETQTTLSEAIDTAKKDGPQVIVRDGVETVVILPYGQWEGRKRCSNEEFLRILQSGPDIEIPIPPRGSHRHRKPLAF